MSVEDSDINRLYTLILDVKQDTAVLTGTMAALQSQSASQNTEAMRKREALEDGQRQTRDMLLPLVATVADMKPKVEELTALRNRFGGVVLTITAVWALICGGFVYFSDILKVKLPH